MRAYLAAIGCKGEEISRAHLAAIGCNRLIHLQAFQSLKLDSTGIRRSRSVYSKFVVLVKYLNNRVTFMFCSKIFSRYSQDQDHESTRTENVTDFFTRNAVLCFYDNYFVAVH